MSQAIVCKFGGSSVATADQVRRVAQIVAADPARRYVVVSAPGKRHASDAKVTDLLYAWHRGDNSARDAVLARFSTLAADLGVVGAHAWIDEVADTLHGGAEEWVASRGEYLSARIIAAYLGIEFVDAADCILFTPEGRLDPQSYARTGRVLAHRERAIVPGFYGATAAGEIRTFSRGGSDVTGAVVARAVDASLYENWTDVNGLLMADPRIVADPAPIGEVTYRELRELAYMGATVLHDEAIFPVRETGIPINIRNTNEPEHAGTRIVAERAEGDLAIVGIAGRTGFATIQIEKAMMNQEIGFGRRLLQVLEEHGVSFEHTPSGIDSMSVILRNEELSGRWEVMEKALRAVLLPDRLEMIGGLAMIATVGQGMIHRIGIASRLFGALAAAHVNVRMINQGASELSIIVGVSEEDYPHAIQAIYTAFVPQGAAGPKVA